jgi:hypothetical protein
MLRSGVRAIASAVVALCLLAAGAARADDRSRNDARTSQLVSAGLALTANLAPRREGASPDLRLAPFTIPSVSIAVAARRSIFALAGRTPAHAVDNQVPARSSRGPPSG